MSTTCSKCRRVNPADAAFCYFDGTLLNGRGATGPVAAGRQAFAHPFVFPSGRQCRSYDELALACNEEWDEARSLLQQGYLERFLGGLGRADLARAARDAARAPDQDRGLDDLLEKLPSDALQPPQLHVGASEINLGTLAIGAERRFELRLENRGMRLLYGSVTCDDSPWLSLGDGAGANQKLFQFGSSTVIPVHVVGQRLRAGNKPLEGRLVVDCNGGQVVVTVRAAVPVRPFPDGVLKGALTPRQIAEKSKAAPKEAAAFFENGAVPKWYRDNGWIYPVQGPAASGLGAVQQFFEALGLTPPPKVEVNTRTIKLTGAAGERLDYVLQVATAEKRPVYAHAVSDQPWLKVGRPNLQGRTATLPLSVPEVPDRPGERLQAQVTVTANGNQRFPVSVSLQVEKVSVARRPAAVFDFSQAEPEPVPSVAAVAAIPLAVPAERKRSRVARKDTDGDLTRRRERAAQAIPLQGPKGSVWKHLVPLAALLVALLVVLGVDALGGGTKPPEPPPVVVEVPIDPDPLIAVAFHDTDKGDVFLSKTGGFKSNGRVDPDSVTPVVWQASMRFGVVMVKGLEGAATKKLTRDDRGYTNNTVIQLDNVAMTDASKPTILGRSEDGLIFGETPWQRKSDGGLEGVDFRGQWKDGERDLPIPADLTKGKGGGRKSVWVYPDQKVTVTQLVEVVAGEQSRKLDTCLVRYLIENKDTKEHRVGLRFMLDTFIGQNDGVPFTIPGEKELCETSKDFARPDDVPDYVEALEHADLKHPGTVARVQLRLGTRIEPPGRVTIGAWPDPDLRSRDDRCSQEKTFWQVPVLPINAIKAVRRGAEEGDSAVVLYWDAKPISAGSSREVGFAYGLGNVASDKDAAGRLGLSVGGNFKPGGEFTLTALVSNPQRKETLTLELPSGFKLMAGEATQPVPEVAADAARRTSPVTWKIKAGSAGSYELKVKSSAGAAQAQPITIRSTSIFD